MLDGDPRERERARLMMYGFTRERWLAILAAESIDLGADFEHHAALDGDVVGVQLEAVFFWVYI